MTVSDTQIDLAREAEFALGGVRFRPSTLEALAGDRREVFEPRIMQVLVALARRKGEVVSREDLTRDCWAGRTVGEDSIQRCIARLRRYAEAEGGFTLETIPRVGYRLVESVTQASGDETRFPRPWSMTDWNLIRLALAALVAAAGLAVWLFWPSPAPVAQRVAVVPFETLSSRDDVRYFGKAVGDEIVGVLNDNQIQALERDASVALRGDGRHEAARKYGVDFLLSGTVQPADKGLHVIVHLERVSTKSTLWSASFDQSGADVLELQSQVAAVAVDQVRAALRARSAGEIGDGALSAYLKAQEYARLGGAEATMMRRDLMRSVVAQAPDFSPGWSGLAVSSAQLLQFGGTEQSRTLGKEARNAAEHALTLNRRNGEAYFAMTLLVPDTDLNERERLYRKGLAVDPDEPTLNSSLAALLSDEGRIEQAVVLQRRAVMLDPLSPRKTAGLAQSLFDSGRTAEARTLIDHAANLWPRNPGVWVVRLLILVGSDTPSQARAMMDSSNIPAAVNNPEPAAAVRAYLSAMASKSPGASANAKRLIIAAVDHGKLNAGVAVEMLARLGDNEAAMTLAVRTYSRDGWRKADTENLFHSATAPLRRDPRFSGIVERLGLFDIWRSAKDRVPDFCLSEDVPVCRELARS